MGRRQRVEARTGVRSIWCVSRSRGIITQRRIFSNVQNLRFSLHQQHSALGVISPPPKCGPSLPQQQAAHTHGSVGASSAGHPRRPRQRLTGSGSTSCSTASGRSTRVHALDRLPRPSRPRRLPAARASVSPWRRLMVHVVSAPRAPSRPRAARAGPRSRSTRRGGQFRPPI